MLIEGLGLMSKLVAGPREATAATGLFWSTIHARMVLHPFVRRQVARHGAFTVIMH